MVNTVWVNANHGRDFHPLTDHSGTSLLRTPWGLDKTDTNSKLTMLTGLNFLYFIIMDDHNGEVVVLLR